MRTGLVNHAIVVGFGRVGRATVVALRERGSAVAVIDRAPELESEVEATGSVYVQGDARDLDALQDAGIARAASLAATLDDPDTLVVVVSARSLRTDLRIVARANDRRWTERMLRAGADQVVPIYDTAGANLAATALTPGVLVISESGPAQLQTHELLVAEGSRAVGLELRRLMEHSPELVLTGVRRDAAVTRWHEFDGPLQVGDVLIALGPAEVLRSLDRLVAPAS